MTQSASLSNFSGIAAGTHCISTVGSKIMVSFLRMAQQSLSHWNSIFRFLGTSVLSLSCLWKRSELICFLRPRYMHITCLFGGYVDELTHLSAFQSVSTAILLRIFPPLFFCHAISWMWIWPVSSRALQVAALENCLMLSYTCRSLLSYKSRISLLIFSDTSTSMSSAEHQSLGRLSFGPINLVAEQRVSFVILRTEPTIPRYITAYAHAFAEWCRQTVVLKLLKVETGYNSRTQMNLPIVCKIPRNLSQFFRAVFGNILVALHLLHSTQQVFVWVLYIEIKSQRMKQAPLSS
jgi:hypothetical protein